MKPQRDDFVMLTASRETARLKRAEENWHDLAAFDWRVQVVAGFGVVPLFAEGMAQVLHLFPAARVIACLHDDVWMEETDWDAKVLDCFADNPQCGLLGFGGATGLGAANIYQVPYDPMQLARQDFVSNMRDAEAHGRRAHASSEWRLACRPERVACLDGFSLIGRREYWEGWSVFDQQQPYSLVGGGAWNLFQRMADAGLVHHAYDSALGCYAKRLGWEVWMLPLRCHHHGGLTAVADPAYHEWAHRQQTHDDERGDQGFWNFAHRWVYKEFRDVLPIRI